MSKSIIYPLYVVLMVLYSLGHAQEVSYFGVPKDSPAYQEAKKVITTICGGDECHDQPMAYQRLVQDIIPPAIEQSSLARTHFYQSLSNDASHLLNLLCPSSMSMLEQLQCIDREYKEGNQILLGLDGQNGFSVIDSYQAYQSYMYSLNYLGLLSKSCHSFSFKKDPQPECYPNLNSNISDYPLWDQDLPGPLARCAWPYYSITSFESRTLDALTACEGLSKLRISTFAPEIFAKSNVHEHDLYILYLHQYPHLLRFAGISRLLTTYQALTGEKLSSYPTQCGDYASEMRKVDLNQSSDKLAGTTFQYPNGDDSKYKQNLVEAAKAVMELKARIEKIKSQPLCITAGAIENCDNTVEQKKEISFYRWQIYGILTDFPHLSTDSTGEIENIELNLSDAQQLAKTTNNEEVDEQLARINKKLKTNISAQIATFCDPVKGISDTELLSLDQLQNDVAEAFPPFSKLQSCLQTIKEIDDQNKKISQTFGKLSCLAIAPLSGGMATPICLGILGIDALWETHSTNESLELLQSFAGNGEQMVTSSALSEAQHDLEQAWDHLVQVGVLTAGQAVSLFGLTKMARPEEVVALSRSIKQFLTLAKHYQKSTELWDLIRSNLTSISAVTGSIAIHGVALGVLSGNDSEDATSAETELSALEHTMFSGEELVATMNLKFATGESIPVDAQRLLLLMDRNLSQRQLKTSQSEIAKLQSQITQQIGTGPLNLESLTELEKLLRPYYELESQQSIFVSDGLQGMGMSPTARAKFWAIIMAQNPQMQELTIEGKKYQFGIQFAKNGLRPVFIAKDGTDAIDPVLGQNLKDNRDLGIPTYSLESLFVDTATDLQQNHHLKESQFLLSQQTPSVWDAPYDVDAHESKLLKKNDELPPTWLVRPNYQISLLPDKNPMGIAKYNEKEKARLIEIADSALSEILSTTPPRPSKFNLIDFSLAVDGFTDPSLDLDRAKQIFEDLDSKLITALGPTPNGLNMKQFNLLREMVGNYVNSYDRREATLTEILTDIGGKCTAQAELYAVIMARHPEWRKFTDDEGKVYNFGIQNYSNHLQAVFYSKAENKAIELIGNKIQHPIDTSIYDPALFYWAFINKHRPDIVNTKFPSDKLLLISTTTHKKGRVASTISGDVEKYAFPSSEDTADDPGTVKVKINHHNYQDTYAESTIRGESVTYHQALCNDNLSRFLYTCEHNLSVCTTLPTHLNSRQEQEIEPKYFPSGHIFEQVIFAVYDQQICNTYQNSDYSLFEQILLKKYNDMVEKSYQLFDKIYESTFSPVNLCKSRGQTPVDFSKNSDLAVIQNVLELIQDNDHKDLPPRWKKLSEEIKEIAKVQEKYAEFKRIDPQFYQPFLAELKKNPKLILGCDRKTQKYMESFLPAEVNQEILKILQDPSNWDFGERNPLAYRGDRDSEFSLSSRSFSGVELSSDDPIHITIIDDSPPIIKDRPQLSDLNRIYRPGRILTPHFTHTLNQFNLSNETYLSLLFKIHPNSWTSTSGEFLPFEVYQPLVQSPDDLIINQIDCREKFGSGEDSCPNYYQGILVDQVMVEGNMICAILTPKMWVDKLPKSYLHPISSEKEAKKVECMITHQFTATQANFTSGPVDLEWDY